MNHGHHDAHPHVNYFAIFIALCVCTAISVVLDILHFNPLLLVVLVLAVAVAKALFVMTYFMHLKFEGKWKFIILAPTAILAVGLMTALAPDMAMHYYDYEVPQSQPTSENEAASQAHSHSESAPAHGAHH